MVSTVKVVLTKVRIFAMCGSSDFLDINDYSRELRAAIYPNLRKYPQSIQLLERTLYIDNILYALFVKATYGKTTINILIMLNEASIHYVLR